MVGNLVRRRFFATNPAPSADGINVDGFQGISDIPHLPAPHLSAPDLWQATINLITDAADAGTGLAVAWGEGNPVWDNTPSEAPPGTTSLYALLGLHPGAWQYVTPDVAGAIIFLEYGTRWTISPTITRYLYVEADYLITEEDAAAIREVGLYLNFDPATGHESDSYLPPSNLDALGTLWGIDRIFLVSRSPATSGKVRFILRVGHA